MITAEEARIASVMHRMNKIEDEIYVACRQGALQTTIKLVITHKERVKLNNLGFLIAYEDSESTTILWTAAEILGEK